MKASEVLKQALALIENVENWTTRYDARDATGHPVSCIDADAKSFCALGAIGKIRPECEDNDYPAEMKHLRAALKEINGSWWISQYNDTHTHEEVKALFRIAIARAEAAGE